MTINVSWSQRRTRGDNNLPALYIASRFAEEQRTNTYTAAPNENHGEKKQLDRLRHLKRIHKNARAPFYSVLIPDIIPSPRPLRQQRGFPGNAGNNVATPLRQKRGDIPHPVMNDDFNTTGMWPVIIDASGRNERVFVFLHESLQLGNQPWAHDPVPNRDPSIVVKDNCNDLIDFSSGVCDVCTDLWSIEAIGNRGFCLFRMADLCNAITYNATRACLDLRMEYGKTLNVIEVDFPGRFPEEGLSVVDIANKFNNLNVMAFGSPRLVPAPDMNNCTPAYTPSPSPSPKPRPSNYCDALKQISETPIYYFQCAPNDACTLLECPIDLFANGAPFRIEISVEGHCDGVGTFVIEIFSPLGSPAGKIAVNETGIYNLLVFPLAVTIDQMGGAIEVEVSQ